MRKSNEVAEKRKTKEKMESTRLMLFYADDVIQSAQKMKSQIGNYMPNQDGTSCSFEYDQSKVRSEIFVKDLRENHGIFFDCSISPDSPNTKARKKMGISHTFSLRKNIELDVAENASKKEELFTMGRSFDKQEAAKNALSALQVEK